MFSSLENYHSSMQNDVTLDQSCSELGTPSKKNGTQTLGKKCSEDRGVIQKAFIENYSNNLLVQETFLYLSSRC